jgi:uncharacterized protein
VIVYFDTSAFIKRFLDEDGSDAVRKLANSTTLAVSSWLLHAEIYAVVARKRREGVIPSKTLDMALADFERLGKAMLILSCQDGLLVDIRRLHAQHAIGGCDSVHLASAISYERLSGNSIAFASADRQQRNAARAEGLTVVP